ncbi:DUF2179 domain-containing protein [bacterium]|nr:DUF2179 domain-containing protein [bacterium]
MPWFVPVLVFIARIMDVSIGTVRIITVTKGHKALSAVLGFCEVTIWIFAVSAVIVNIRESLWTVFAYASGFSVGTLVGMVIEEKLAIGTQVIRIVNRTSEFDLSELLRQKGFMVTKVEAAGGLGPSELCFLVVPRKRTQSVLDVVEQNCPSAFITVEDVRRSSVETRLFPGPRSQTPFWKRLTKFK